MEEIRKIVKEELLRLQIDENQEGSDPFKSHPYFGNPEKMYNEAMKWMDKAHKLGHFHQLVGNVLWDTTPSEEKIEVLMDLYREFVKFK